MDHYSSVLSKHSDGRKATVLDHQSYEAGRLRLIDKGGPFFSSATAINDRGQVAGVLDKEDEPQKPSEPVKGEAKNWCFAK